MYNIPYNLLFLIWAFTIISVEAAWISGIVTLDRVVDTPIMFKVEVPDAAGETMKLVKLDGKLYPDFFGLNLIEQIRTNSMRPDDIMISAFPKCGTHWVREITRCILAQTTDLPVEVKEVLMLECTSNSDLEKCPSPRILNCHLLYEQLPEELAEKKCKIIYIYRNFKDMAVSFYHHHKQIFLYDYDGQWDNFLPMLLDGKLDYGSWFEHVRDWEERIANNQSRSILVLFYEDIKENPHREVSKIAKFLDKDCSDEFIQEVCDKCHFDVMKRTKGHLVRSRTKEPVMYRKGKVGDWKNYFTDAQNEMFERKYSEKMAGSRLKFRYDI